MCISNSDTDDDQVFKKKLENNERLHYIEFLLNIVAINKYNSESFLLYLYILSTLTLSRKTLFNPAQSWR